METKEALNEIATVERVMDLTAEIASLANTISAFDRLVLIKKLRDHYSAVYVVIEKHVNELMNKEVSL